MDEGAIELRGPAEIAFRLWQEFHNLRGYVLPPSLPDGASASRMEDVLPPGSEAANALRGTAYAAGLIELADRMLEHEFPVLGRTLKAGSEIRWNRDYFNDREWVGSAIPRRIPYLDATRVGDHKFVWELNRQQQLVLLAQAWLLTRREEYIQEIERQVDHWIEHNPYARGMQWVSALEAAFRALSFLWLWQLVHEALSESCRRRLLQAIWRHGLFLRRNLSIYYSPNTHLLGEAVALHAIGRLFPGLPHARDWQATGARIVEEQMGSQIREDGSHFEQSTYYHVYACDFFLFHALLVECSDGYRERLRRAGKFLWDMLGPAGRISFFGDEDGGRLFHPYGDRAAFGQATLAAMGAFLDEEEWRGSAEATAEIGVWWLGRGILPRVREQWLPSAQSAVYQDAQVVTLWSGRRRQIITDIRALGRAPSGHSHAHALSLVLRDGPSELLVDPGAFTYFDHAGWRSRFRATAMHNTIVVEGREQAQSAGLFRWESALSSSIVSVGPQSLEASCRYAGCSHVRSIQIQDDKVVIIDSVEVPDGVEKIYQFWHPGVPAVPLGGRVFSLDGAATLKLADQLRVSIERGGSLGWISPSYGSKVEADVVWGEYCGPFPVQLSTEIVFAEHSRV